MGMGQFQLQQQLSKPTPAANPCTLSPLASYGYNPMSVRTLTICHRLSVDPKLTGTLNSARSLPFLPALRPRFLCKSDNSGEPPPYPTPHFSSQREFPVFSGYFHN
uniref:Uncharacterized protein n=1 Tax=Rhizophora mucronata TaxID=61149 RepID=A0A2P2JHB1_RHIMU